jgi:hypothetical protein
MERGAFNAGLKPKLDEAGSNATVRVDERCMLLPTPK